MARSESTTDCQWRPVSSRRERPALVVTFPDAAWKRRFRRRLAAWYRQHARDLPWRRRRNLYRVWVSEMMLQQTQAATVGPYFERFVAAFPDAASLAAAREEDVLRLWEGLGYYRRARQLHQAARVIVQKHGGRFPRRIEQVRALPGVGRYTAGAILSIALDARHPILEANTARLFSRLLASREDPSRSAGRRLLWRFSQELLPRRGAGDFNQALMELGAICTPRAPRCDQCPVAPLCRARELGRQEEIPPPKKKTRYQDVLEAAVVVRKGNRILLRRCGPGERWAGLWDFPRFALDSSQRGGRSAELVEKVREMTGVTVQLGRRLATIKHGVTRFRITLACYEAAYRAGRARRPGRELKWTLANDLDQTPLNVTGRRICGLLARHGDSHPASPAS